MELEASFLERAELDVHELVSKATHIETRLDELLSDEHQARLMSLVESLNHTVDRVGWLARDIEPSVRALPALVLESHGAMSSISKLADDTDQKLAVLDQLSVVAQQVGRATDDLHRDTLPRVNALVDEVSVDARELRRTLHQANSRPQSFIFGLEPPIPGPGERGYTQTAASAK
jgi:phospholipid/cholesterol/gamma-HCH transport system substrate-binding protein